MEKRQVIVGAAEFFIGDSDATAPTYVAADTAQEALATGADFESVGYTQDGVEVSYEPDYGEVEVDQALDSVRIFKNTMRVMVNTTFAEATLENLLVVWAQPSSTLTVDPATVTDPDTGNATTGVQKTLTIRAGELGEAPLERQLVAVGNGREQDNGKYAERIYHVTRALSVESSSHAMRRSEATVFPVSFRLLPASTAGNPYGTITERIRP